MNDFPQNLKTQNKQILMKKFIEFEDACKENRVFPVCDYLNYFEQELENMAIEIPEGFSMYRARIYNDELLPKAMQIIENIHNAKTPQDFEHAEQQHKSFETQYRTNIEHGFWGYDEKGSFINPDSNSIKAGRCNHDFETCLYTAENPNTAISELKPLIKEKISVAEIITLQNLKIIDLSFSINQEEELFKNLIALLFVTSPTECNKDAYIYTQAICSLVKKHGYDGIKYSSCQNMHYNNYAIFNYTKCKAIKSDIYFVNSINYECDKQTPRKKQS